MRKLKSQRRKVAEAELTVFILGLFCNIAPLLILEYLCNNCFDMWFMYIVASFLAVVNSG